MVHPLPLDNIAAFYCSRATVDPCSIGPIGHVSLALGEQLLGSIQSRSFLGAVYKTKLPGAPNGKYVVIRYRASFENKEDAVETLTPMLDQDGIWRASGYFIR